MVWSEDKELNNGKFIIVGKKPLGSGGFGITYKVARTRDRKLFVIKTLNAIAQSKSNFRQLKDDFLNEAHTLAGFKHDHIVKIYPKGFTEQEDNLWCMVMEFIEGQNLEEYLEENKEISEINAIALITKVGEALTYIHQSSYLHRDIKPSNIMLRNSDLSSPVLIDFGLAREFDPNQSLTMDSRLTEHFAPLEQYDLDSLSSYINVDKSQYKVGTWTDVYSLAATLYNLLTNQKPMVVTFRQLTPKDFKSPKQLNPKISDRTNAAILKGMSLNPQDRSPTISEWFDLLSGKVLNNGLYRLQKPLKQNHMCKNAYDFSDEYNIVYQAIETKSQTPVIIKTLSKETLTSSLNSDLTLEKAIAYLKNEAKLTQEIRQYDIPNAVRFRDYFEEFGIPYLVLDYIEGENLFRLVERSDKLSEERAIKYIKQIASALLICHKHKIYHRDINPDNIIIRSQDDQAILIDFDVSSNAELTGNNFFKPPQPVNKRNFDIDLYSLAATLYYLVTEVNPSGGLHDLVINKWFDYDHEKQKQILKNPKKLNPNLSEYIDHAIIEGMKCESGVLSISIQKWLQYLDPTKDVGKIIHSSTNLENITRKIFLRWIGWLGMGAVGATTTSYLINQNTNESKLYEYYFDSVTVNDKGQEINRQKLKTRYFIEDLGDNIVLEMIEIPQGSFFIGSSIEEKKRFDNEGLQHIVNISSFFLCKFAVTQAQWKKVATLPKVKIDLNSNSSKYKGDNLPVENISWYDAIEFCSRLSKATGRNYRLPSESEWEYACKAGTSTPFCFGETITTDLVNYDGNSVYANEPQGQFRQQTTPVGSFSPNAFGLYDMHGNVWEWCEDLWHDDYQGIPTDGSAWIDKIYKIDAKRVLRGGYWGDKPKNCRSSVRNRNYPDNIGYSHGFRCAINSI